MVSGAGDLVRLIPGDPSQHLHIVHLLLLPPRSSWLGFDAEPDPPLCTETFSRPWERCWPRDLGQEKDLGSPKCFPRQNLPQVVPNPGLQHWDPNPDFLELHLGTSALESSSENWDFLLLPGWFCPYSLHPELGGGG